ncbi:MAG: zinc permease [Betaproteobacteria bacterium]|nr:MAG: zinc permease [Betaproteobacteria bacterium]
MSATHVAVVLLSLMSCVTVLAGVALALRLRENARALAAGIGFSAGIMILISVWELVPESVSTMGWGPAAGSVAAGAALVWSAHLIIPHVHLFVEAGLADRALARTAYLVAFGLILHDVPEGFAMANAYVANPALGVLVSLAIALHNLPEEFAMSVPLVLLRSKASLYGAAALSALAEPLGAVIGLLAVGIAPALNAHFLAFAAGAMLFVAIHELVPMARRYRHLGFFFWGILGSVLVYALLARLTTGLVSS